ncbi:MAG: ribosome modulation factor [Pseudomonadota bacterium]
MKRQKRDRLTRARSNGFKAGVTGRPRDCCPYSSTTKRGEWHSGWREARNAVSSGFY